MNLSLDLGSAPAYVLALAAVLWLSAAVLEHTRAGNQAPWTPEDCAALCHLQATPVKRAEVAACECELSPAEAAWPAP